MSPSERTPRLFRAGRPMRVVRRIHMYAGLLLLPWLLVFGLSGMLFNHPNVGRDVRAQPLDRRDVEALTRVRPWDPPVIASHVVAGLNAGPAGAGAARYRLDPEYQGVLTGFTVLGAKGRDEQHTLLLDLEQASGVLVTTREPPARNETSSFPRQRVALPEFTTQAVQTQVAGLLAARRLDADSELLAHPKIAPELRFRMRDENDTSWNMVYDAGTGMVSGRRSDSFPDIGLTQLLATMHKTHHFPLQLGAPWFWALFADLLGITMVLWSLTGLAMWWQMKPTRVLGAVSLAVALGLAAIIMGGTAQHLTFGDMKAKLGPGD